MEIITLTRPSGKDWMLEAMYTMRKARGLGMVNTKEIDILTEHLKKNPDQARKMTTAEINKVIGR